ncbi:hypothetical protein MSMTP_0931 [Methanosarcina sp. MTP4]|uniref:DUF354 domain-containing protein n=1 Tax=Methanosarcina sp. MTP4 TaxID=1434100 RepID=UPI000615CD8B|nr:DUF354 domain-containing protein [Methanosarcina sp. MTP4]AKB24400.1 hypothetical protein MSMTP_0931 [Methanosarcina sp. MTP4]
MRILFNICHPAQVHLFKYVIRGLENKGHECKITAIDKDVSLNLLDAYGFDYEVVGSARSGLFSKAVELIEIDKRVYNIAKYFKPDILVGGSGNAYSAHIGKLIGKPSIIFEDSEKGTIEHLLTNPFATVICTTSSFKKELGAKQISFDGYKELAYLHPNRFHPKQAVLDELGFTGEDTFIILRFVAWDADHDIGHQGIQNKIEFVKELEKYGRVLITSEEKLGSELEKYRVSVSPEKLHDLLYYTQMLVGDSQTMTTEAAVLGVPAIRCNSFVGNNDMSNFIELEQKYNLIFNYSDSGEALKKAVELINKPERKEEWDKKRERLLKEKIDVTAFMTWFIESYPDSFKEMKENPDFQYNFR